MCYFHVLGHFRGFWLFRKLLGGTLLLFKGYPVTDWVPSCKSVITVNNHENVNTQAGFYLGFEKCPSKTMAKSYGPKANCNWRQLKAMQCDNSTLKRCENRYLGSKILSRYWIYCQERRKTRTFWPLLGLFGLSFKNCPSIIGYSRRCPSRQNPSKSPNTRPKWRDAGSLDKTLYPRSCWSSASPICCSDVPPSMANLLFSFFPIKLYLKERK